MLMSLDTINTLLTRAHPHTTVWGKVQCTVCIVC